jgi:diguanylate cyclase (GGDEF)-like protein
MLLPDTDPATALQVAERLRQLVAECPFELGSDLTVPVTVSIGVAMCCGRDDLDRLLARTDQALYEAKDGGRNQVRLSP